MVQRKLVEEGVELLDEIVVLIEGNSGGSALFQVEDQALGSGWVREVGVMQVGEVVGGVDGGKADRSRLRVGGKDFVLDEQAFVHLLEALHVAGDVVLYVLDAADLEDHELVDGVPHVALPAGLYLGQFLADGRVGEEILLDGGVVAVDAVGQGVLPGLQPLLCPLPFLEVGPRLLPLPLQCLVAPAVVALGQSQFPKFVLGLGGGRCTRLRMSLTDCCLSLRSCCWGGSMAFFSMKGIMSFLMLWASSTDCSDLAETALSKMMKTSLRGSFPTMSLLMLLANLSSDLA